jgi:aspartate kinase
VTIGKDRDRYRQEEKAVWRITEKMIKVVKFGGSSLASAEQFKKVGRIIRKEESRRYVIPSAPGKRTPDDTKVTDMLYSCYNLAAIGDEYEEEFEEQLAAIRERYDAIIRGLDLSVSLEEEFKAIRTNFCRKAGRDYAASRGEYLNGILMANYLDYEFIDAAEVIFFDESGNFDGDKTNQVLAERLARTERAVIPGFYGSMPDGSIRTFSRGGSDITGSIVAKAVQADMYENWTDVSGFLIADPRIIQNPKAIDVITYRELRELSYMGATVLHEDAIFPVRKEGIPINIRNTNSPEDKGTLIVEGTCRKPRFVITGIAGKKDFASVTVEKAMMNSEVGFCKKVLEVFDENNISIEHMPSGIDTMTIFVHQDEFEEKEQKVIAGIHRRVEPDFLDLESDLALIAVVGRGMRATRGTSGRIFSALAHANVNVKMIDQGSSELNIIIGVRNHDFETAVKAIYDIFVNTMI